jgi:hypothetical protein
MIDECSLAMSTEYCSTMHSTHASSYMFRRQWTSVIVARQRGRSNALEWDRRRSLSNARNGEYARFFTRDMREINSEHAESIQPTSMLKIVRDISVNRAECHVALKEMLLCTRIFENVDSTARERATGRASSSGADRAFNSLSNGTYHASNRYTDAELMKRQWTRNGRK